jgi:hypothetical protein
VLYWVVKGKINRDIADILGSSPATVKKHLERVFDKLGVETRTAAAGMAMNRIRQLHPQFEGLLLIYQAGTHTRHGLFMNVDHTKIAVGKYLVSPLAKQQGEGYAASVSIRSGRGSATHDRVLRFSGLFDSAAAAVHYATEHALGWIHERSSPACA